MLTILRVPTTLKEVEEHMLCALINIEVTSVHAVDALMNKDDD